MNTDMSILYPSTYRWLEGYAKDRWVRTIRVEQKEELVWYLGDDEGNRYDGQEHLDRNPQLRTADGSGRMLGTLALGWGGNDTMFGTRYRDSIYGHQGNDRLYGRDGNDEISGGDGNDFLDGGAGNDTFISGDGSDYIRGGDGHDLIYVSSVDCQNEVVGSDDREWVYAEGGNDTVHGQQGNDFINGGDGNKLIYGEGGSDIIIGGLTMTKFMVAMVMTESWVTTERINFGAEKAMTPFSEAPAGMTSQVETATTQCSTVVVIPGSGAETVQMSSM